MISYNLTNIIKWLYFFLIWPILEARPEILTKKFTFREIWRHQNHLFRLTDLLDYHKRLKKLFYLLRKKLFRFIFENLLRQYLCINCCTFAINMKHYSLEDDLTFVAEWCTANKMAAEPKIRPYFKNKLI